MQPLMASPLAMQSAATNVAVNLPTALPFFRSFSCNGKTDSGERSESEAQPLL